jgi:hypothetical protein
VAAAVAAAEAAATPTPVAVLRRLLGGFRIEGGGAGALKLAAASFGGKIASWEASRTASMLSSKSCPAKRAAATGGGSQNGAQNGALRTALSDALGEALREAISDEGRHQR